MTGSQDHEQLRFTTIHHHLLRQLDITANESLILDTVYHLSRKYGYCYKSVPAIAYDLNMTKMGAYKIIKRLLERNLLVQSAAGLVCSQTYIDAAYFHDRPVNKVDRIKPTKSKQSIPKGKQRLLKSKQSTPKNNNRITKNNTLRQKRSDARKILDYWNTIFSTNIKPLDSRLDKLVKRMDTFKPEEICVAINHAAADPFFMGEGPRGWRGNVDYLIRNDENTEKYLHLKPKARSTYE